MNATGLLAGAVGTAVSSVFECLESVALGQRPRYPTMSEALNIGVQAFSRDVSKLSSCAE